MAQINVVNLTYGYEDSVDTVFERVSFSVDTNWKLGLLGRNGKGKTTFLNLLLGIMNIQGQLHLPPCLIIFHMKFQRSEWSSVHLHFCRN